MSTRSTSKTTTAIWYMLIADVVLQTGLMVGYGVYTYLDSLPPDLQVVWWERPTYHYQLDAVVTCLYLVQYASLFWFGFRLRDYRRLLVLLIILAAWIVYVMTLGFTEGESLVKNDEGTYVVKGTYKWVVQLYSTLLIYCYSVWAFWQVARKRLDAPSRRDDVLDEVM